MVQLRHDYPQFVERQTEVIAVGPDSKQAFQDFWEAQKIPFIGLADPEHEVARQYEQEVNLLKLGRMPTQILMDRLGVVRFVHYSGSMADITENEVILRRIDDLDLTGT
jgi:peroxiredoxin Q/BCP